MPTDAGESAGARQRPAPFAVPALAATALLFYCVAFQLGFPLLPLFFLALGFISYARDGRKALLLFLFLLPLANSTPDLFLKGYPFNYIGVPLFQLAGILCASLVKKERPATAFPGRAPYLLLLALLWISAAFVFLRWSNLGLSPLAFLRDTPVAPSMERVSYACILPAITLALFSVAPWASFLIRLRRLGEAEVMAPLKAGFLLSLLLALGQKWIDQDFLAQGWWGRKMGQLNGGFSDFNAFGFFAGAMFLYQSLKLIRRLSHEGPGNETEPAAPVWRRLFGGGCLWADLLFLAAALAAVFLSGCRTSILFVIAALGFLILARKPAWWIKAAAVLLLAAMLLFGGGTLGRRLRRSLDRAKDVGSKIDLLDAVDEISNTRLDMLRDGGRMVARFPLSGVGAGNFLFYLKYMHFGEKAYYDLPLNEYLLFFTETGVIGGVAFLLFMAALLLRLRQGTARLMMAVLAVALFFNNFFWFPEVLLLFWCFVALVAAERGGAADRQAPPMRRRAFLLAAAAVVLFIAANIMASGSLHPAAWAREKSTPYDYGFSYPENDRGRPFRWTGAAAGMYLRLDGAAPVSLYCGAPLVHMPGNRQTVDIYWGGKLYRRFVFHANREFRLRLESAVAGFLEFRVHPAFNLEKMGIGADTRDLGVQVNGPGI